MTDLPYRILGNPARGGLLIVSDHASNHVPAEIDLGLDPEQMERHIAWDIGVAAIAEKIVNISSCAAVLGNVSRLVVDLNRYPDEPDVIPTQSDGLFIPGNQLDQLGRSNRIAAHFTPYHDILAALVKNHRPALILSVHSFTPQLASRPHEHRPWELGVLYNDAEAASKCAISFLEAAGVQVGDQLPYSGKVLNATMNRHAEANDIPYIGIELRQDEVMYAAGQERFARILTEMCHYVSEKLGLGLQRP